MGYLKTILTYHQPSEAEVDKAFLESHGFVVCLLNGNTSRNELGAPFFIQLQVVEEHHARATAILREANPARFGSAAKVAELDRQIKSAVAAALLGAVPIGFLVYFFFPRTLEILSAGDEPMRDFRMPIAIAAGFIGGYFGVLINRRMKRSNAVRA